MKLIHSALVLTLFFIFTVTTFSAGREIEMEKNSIIELQNRLTEKQDEINELKQELANERSNGSSTGFLSAGFGSGPAIFLYMLLFSIAVGVISTVVVRRKTQSLCHCLNRRKKMLEKQKMLQKQADSSKIS